MSIEDKARAVAEYVAARSYLPKGLSDLVADLMAAFGQPEVPPAVEPLDINPSPGFYKYAPGSSASGVWVVPGPTRLLEVVEAGMVHFETIDGTVDHRYFFAATQIPVRVSKIFTAGTQVKTIRLYK